MPGNVDESRQGGRKCPPADTALAALATRQHGVVARRQLLALGYGADAIRYRERIGRLHRVQVGVYAPGYDRVAPLGRSMTAVLTCGDGALICHQSATSLHGVLDSARALIDVTVPAHGPRRREGIAIHRRQALHEDDCAVVDGIPVTSIARTLRDLAAVVPARRLERAFEEAERLRLLDRRQLEAVGERRCGKRGARAFERMLGQGLEPVLTRSELERRFLGLCADAGLPRPVVNGVVHGMEVDFHWPGDRLVVELDGFAYHNTRAAFERDRRRDATLQLAGQRVVRLTAGRVEDGPRMVSALLAMSSPARPAARPAA